MTFDRFQDTYAEELERALGGLGDVDLYTDAKAQVLIRAAEDRLGDPAELSVLDVGCGPGLTDSYLTNRFKRVAGVDISTRLIDRARAANPAAEYQVYDGKRLPFDDGSFDLVFAICVLHHVEQFERQALTAEMARVTRPGGLVAVQEHNPLNPVTRRVVARCPFDDGVELISAPETTRLLTAAGLDRLARSYVLFFPWHSTFLRRLERHLGRLPLGAQYMIAGQRP